MYSNFSVSRPTKLRMTVWRKPVRLSFLTSNYQLAEEFLIAAKWWLAMPLISRSRIRGFIGTFCSMRRRPIRQAPPYILFFYN